MKQYPDKFGKDASPLKSKKLFLLDMDGTIYEENRLFKGTKNFLSKIKEIGGRYVFITNNSSKSVYDYIKKIGNMGIPAVYEDFFTSAQATILHIKQNYPGKKVFCVGTQSLVNELIQAGIDVTDEVTPSAKVILIGYDTELTYEKLRRVSEMLIKYDSAYIATNPDKACPVSFGFVPDCAAICEMLYMATGKRPNYIGKPQPDMVNFVMQKYGYSKEETLIVGDRLYTDIATGTNAGVDTVCVLSGEASLDDIKNGTVKPTYTLDSITDIYNII